MNGEECFDVWAPDTARWSRWARPVLFTQMEYLRIEPGPLELSSIKPGLLPSDRPEMAVVVDLPGAHSVVAGLLLARRGFRPVPLFNGTSGHSPLVDVGPIAQLMVNGIETLREAGLRAGAPPAFLIDSRRMEGTPRPQQYDNRWLVLPQDFPSATFLKSHGIREVLLLQFESDGPGNDLCHILRRWQDAGLPISRDNIKDDDGPHPLQVNAPPMFRQMWYAAIAILGLHRNNVGGFGGVVPDPSTGGGYG